MFSVKPLRLVRLVRFGFVGVLNTVFGYGFYFLLVYVGMLPELALLGATVLGVVFNFFTTARLVFRNRDNRLIGRFALTYVIIYLVNALVLRLLIATGADPFLSQAAILPFTTLGAFAIMRIYVFREAQP
ncbi:GtrA family protein [Rhizobiales bacterium RZME27]|uniref:GtrA family protein n=1 Tax=Endobacterium cereale TaxID=2663029 RepID=A0A6A8A6B4_9HYPH|nr:GtrA family protein [Endobacterium cereale]MQY46653.1 GtrA family protein [Endobacterium cereale]